MKCFERHYRFSKSISGVKCHTFSDVKNVHQEIVEKSIQGELANVSTSLM